MTCSSLWATAQQFADFWCVEINGIDEEAQVERYLKRASGTINMAIQAQGACDCTMTSASIGYLRDLAIVLAVVYHVCPCARPNLSIEQQRMYLEQVTNELGQIRRGEIELCSGATGADFPAIAWAEQSLTDFAAARIIKGAVDRGL